MVNRRAVARIVNFMAASLAIGLFVLVAVENFDRLQAYPIEPSGLFVLAGLAFISAVLVGGVNWRAVISHTTGHDLKLGETVMGHAQAWLYRYIPGIGYLGFKVSWALQRGISRGAVVSAFLYEQILIQASSMLFGVLAISLSLIGARSVPNVVWFALAATAVGLLAFVFSGKTLSAIVQKMRKRRDSTDDSSPRFLNPIRVVQLLGGFVIPRLLNAVAIVAIAVALTPLTVEQLVALGGAYAVASAVGIIAVFAPSGLGVREGVFVALAILAGVDIVDAIMLSVIARVISTIADFAIGAVVITERAITQGKKP